MAETSVSVMSYGVPKAPWNSAAYAATGSLPLSRTKTAPREQRDGDGQDGDGGPLRPLEP